MGHPRRQATHDTTLVVNMHALGKITDTGGHCWSEKCGLHLMRILADSAGSYEKELSHSFVVSGVRSAVWEDVDRLSYRRRMRRKWRVQFISSDTRARRRRRR